jgi:hypothetical protein
MKPRCARLLTVAAAVGAVVVGLIAIFVTLPSSCSSTPSQLVAQLPETLGLWIASMALWLAVVTALVVVFWRLQKMGSFGVSGPLVVAGAGLVGSAIAYYFLAAPQDSLTCNPDGLGTFAALGGGPILLVGVIAAFVSSRTGRRPRGET